MDKLEQLQKFAEWEHQNRPAPDGNQHIAAWAAMEIARLRARVLELEAVHEDASGDVLAERERWTQLAQEIDYGTAHGWPLETLTRITAIRVAMFAREQGPNYLVSGTQGRREPT